MSLMDRADGVYTYIGTSKDIGPVGQISAHRCPTDLKLIPNEADGKLSK